MKLVIDIPESTYEVCKSYLNYKSDNAFAEKIKQSIANGTPLPKGHGRLIDGDELDGVMYHEAFEKDTDLQKMG